MKKNLISLLLMLGFIFVISPMVLSCSDSEEPGVEPDVPVNPDVPLPPNPTPIRWVENEVDGGERGVGIKVTSNTEHNFVFECTPGSKVQSYRLDVYPLCRMYNYLFESVGTGVQATEEEVEDLIMEAIYNSEVQVHIRLVDLHWETVIRMQNLTGPIRNIPNRKSYPEQNI